MNARNFIATPPPCCDIKSKAATKKKNKPNLRGVTTGIWFLRFLFVASKQKTASQKNEEMRLRQNKRFVTTVKALEQPR